MSHFDSFDLPNLPCRLIVISDRVSGGFQLIELVPRLTCEHFAESVAETGQPLIKTEQRDVAEVGVGVSLNLAEDLIRPLYDLSIDPRVGMAQAAV